VTAAESGGDANEDLCTLVGRQRLVHGRFRGVDRAARILRACLRHAAHDLS
jgi:hypothetical protein